MSHCCDERYEIYDETYVCAAKEHTCDACKDIIPKGHYYARIFWVFDGEGGLIKRCKKCQMIHLHLRKKGDSEMWPDERLNCGEEYKDHWGEDPPAHIAVLAFATPEEVQQMAVPKDI
jgi:hypothetical protein